MWRRSHREWFFLPNSLIREWLFLATNERLAANRASTKLNTLGITQIRMGSRKDARGNGCRGWFWTGEQAKRDAPVRALRGGS